MIATKTLQMESVREESIRELAESPGPCITICMPRYRPGEQSVSADTQLKTDVREAKRQLEARKIKDGQIVDLLEPLQAVADDPEPSGSHWSSMIFRSSQMLRQFSVTGLVNPSVTVGSRFEIRPLLAELPVAREFYVLTPSQKRVGLMRCFNFEAERVALPKGIPDNLEEALAMKAPDHDLENRSAAAGSAKRGIRFGTSSDRDKHRAYLMDFYRILDRGMHDLLSGRGSWLLLAGVEEDTSTYAAINTYPNLLVESIRGNSLEAPEMLRHAYEIIRRENTRREAKDLTESKERVAPSRFPTDVNRILHAAAGGQVERLYLAEGATRMGHFHDKRTGVHTWENEDLLNCAAVQTIVHAGHVFLLSAADIPKGTEAAAFLRY